MGNLIVFKSTIREEMQPYTALTLAQVRKLTRRFDSLQQSFGFGITVETFAALFKVDAQAPETQALWACWDTDANGVTDALEILAALTLVAQGKFEEKLEACFALFDFDENSVLTSEEMTICIRTSVCGLCKLLDQVEPPVEEIDRLAAKAFSLVGAGARSITKDQFLLFVVSVPVIIATVCRFGTNNGEATKRKYAELMSENKAATKIQEAFKQSKGAGKDSASASAAAASAGSTAAAAASSSSSSSRQTPSRTGGHRRRDDPNYQSRSSSSSSSSAAAWHFDYDVQMVRRAKSVFDAIDVDASGSISARELRQSMAGQEFAGAALDAFAAMDTSGGTGGGITFEGMLRVLYPQAKAHELVAMVREVSGHPVDAATVGRLRVWFEDRDRDFDGKVILDDLVQGLRDDDAWCKYVAGYTPPAKLADKPIGFQTLLTELFGTTHRGRRLSQILAWSRQVGPVHALDAHQQAELEHLFSLYDKDASGSVTMAEMRAHFDGLGFGPQAEVDRLFAKYDADGDQRVDLNEFKAFYRRVWNSASRNRANDGQAYSRPTTSTETPAAKANTQLEDEYRSRSRKRTLQLELELAIDHEIRRVAIGKILVS